MERITIYIYICSYDIPKLKCPTVTYKIEEITAHEFLVIRLKSLF